MNGTKTPWNDVSSIWKKIAAVIAAVGVLATLTITIFKTPADITYIVYAVLGLILLMISWYVDKQAFYSHRELVDHENQARERVASALGDLRESIRQVDEASKDRVASFNDRVDKIIGIVEDTRKDTLRIQLLMLMREDNDNVDTILRIAETYFVKLQGDWYMTSEFCKWAKAHDVLIPNNIWDSIKDREDLKF